MCLREQVICAFLTWHHHALCSSSNSSSSSSMSLQQSAGDHSWSKSQPRTRFTIDSILDMSPTRRATDDEKSTPSVVLPSDDESASANDRDDSVRDAFLPPLCGETGRQLFDEKHSRERRRIDHVDGDLGRVREGSAADVETEQRGVQCSSLLARTAAAFHRRHHRRVAQLRSFGELFLAQYQQYQCQLRNHFRHHSALQPSAVDVLGGPLPQPPARNRPGLDCYRQHHPPDAVHSPRILHGHCRQSPTPASTSVHSRTTKSASRTTNWSAVDQQPLLVTQPCSFVDGSVVHRVITPPPVGIHSANETLDKYSHDRSPTKWTASNNIGTLLSLCRFYTHLLIRIKYKDFEKICMIIVQKTRKTTTNSVVAEDEIFARYHKLSCAVVNYLNQLYSPWKYRCAINIIIVRFVRHLFEKNCIPATSAPTSLPTCWHIRWGKLQLHTL